jgi:hypothetical protein
MYLLYLNTKGKENDLETILKFCKLNISKISTSLNSPLDPFDNTLLHVSVSNDDYILTLILLRKGANPNIPNKVILTKTSPELIQ